MATRSFGFIMGSAATGVPYSPPSRGVRSLMGRRLRDNMSRYKRGRQQKMNIPWSVCLDLLWYPFSVLEQLFVLFGAQCWELALHIDQNKSSFPHALSLDSNLTLQKLSRQNVFGEVHSRAELALQTNHLVGVCGLLGTSLAYSFAFSSSEADI